MDEATEAKVRRERKRERDREYWERHREKINTGRREKYQKEKLLIERLEKDNDEP